MLFSSTVFLNYFLPLLLLCYYLIPRRLLPLRNGILLLFSLGFYAFGGLRYFWLLCAVILADYLAGLFISLTDSRKLQRLILILNILLTLGLLGYYKYAGFAAAAAASLGVPITVPEIVLPIGISFFTFQGLSYVADVYRNDAPAQKNPLNVALYISLFPQLVAGPIVRYTSIAEGLGQREHTLDAFTRGLVRFLLGFGKKMLLANAMGEIADAVFRLTGHPSLTASLAWVGAVAYTFQIYFDFSGYSDMAIGLGMLFGFRFEENFRYPYIADSVTDFWRRWHISLSSWFRDYVYIPLGGNRCSPGRHVLNLLIVWFLTGLWHGANWTFILWGLYYGLLLLLEKYPLRKVLSRFPSVIRRLFTLILVILGWVLFRSDSIARAGLFLRSMFGGSGFASGQAVFYLRQYWPEFVCCILAALPLKQFAEHRLLGEMAAPGIRSAARIAAMAFAALVFVLGYMKLVYGGFNPFIYFQF